MEYRYLGQTGLKVSELCLGAMTLGREADEAASFEMMDAFADAGGNFIDTADVYTRGASETVVGKWLANRPREQWIIATKVRFTMGDAPNDVGLSRKHIRFAIEESLRRLQTDYVDLYQVHCWDPGTPLEETLSTLNQLVQEGKVRYIGVSNYKPSQIQKAVDISRAHGWEPFTCLQPLYNLLDRTLEWELLEVCQNEGLGIIPWSPLRGGWLTGRYRRGMELPNDDSRVAKASRPGGGSEKWENYNNERTWNVIDVLVEVAEKIGKTPAQVALSWVKDRPGVTAPIIGARSITQLQDNLGVIGWTLDAESLQALNDVSEIGLPYPYEFVARNAPGRTR